ncbi:MAG: PspC domain-containing protein [Candidatus Zambryskibacteria bacterium]|nr:PspC domain-containing protein [Candidatus Zambryskibacteria bacterium]
MKKLYKNQHDEVLTGVIGGIGEYFSIDPVVLRIGFVILVLISGIFPGIIAYIIAYFIIPEKPHGMSTLVTPPPMKTPETPVAEPTPTAPATTNPEEQKMEVKEESVVAPIMNTEAQAEEVVTTTAPTKEDSI